MREQTETLAKVSESLKEVASQLKDAVAKIWPTSDASLATADKGSPSKKAG
jgi:SRSO17 transposase